MKAVYLKDLKVGQPFYLLNDSRSLIFKGWCKEKHWYEYEIPNYGYYHFAVPHRNLLDFLHFKIVYISDEQLTLF